MKKIIVANWKMYLTLRASVALARHLTKFEIGNSKLEIIACPSFVALEEVAKILRGTRVKLGTQDVQPAGRGAFTGAVGLDDLGDLKVEYVLVGHSERRQKFGETDTLVNKKLRAVLKAKMRPILCVGEPWSVRRQGAAQQYVAKQLRSGLHKVAPQDLKRVLVAYEPIWAIWPGRADTPEDALAMQRWICKARGQNIPILYGGSVNARNVADFAHLPEFAGLLIGKASTQALEFKKILQILKYACP